jgi:hypothetical protein
MEIIYREENEVTCEVTKHTRNAAYPSDTMYISFGDASCEDVQIAINSRGNVYIDYHDIDGERHKVELGEAE